MSGLLRLLLVLLIFALSVPVSGYGPPTLIESESAATPVSPGVLRQMNADRLPETLAKAAVIVDAVTGQVIFEKNAHERRAPASTTKMMTALVALSNARLDEVVEAGPMVKTVEPTIIGLDPGDKLTVEQLLYGLLLPSGNDAAIAIAEHIGGSIPQFATMMNAKAAQLGLKDTQFKNPHGLDEDGHYSSAYDLAMIARAALSNPVFERVVSTREYRIQGPPSWLFRNSNRLLGAFNGADGVKTGYTDNAGRSLVFSATRDGRRAISVVLDSGTQWDDSTALLEYFFRNYGWETLNVADSPLLLFTQGEELRQAVVRSQPQLIFPRWQLPYMRWFFAPSGGATSADGSVGTASYYLFDKKVGQIELFDGGGTESARPR